jgi:hypothetical protein
MSVTGANSSGDTGLKRREFGAHWRDFLAWFDDARVAADKPKLKPWLETNHLPVKLFLLSVQAVGDTCDNAGPEALLNVFRKRRCQLAKLRTVDGGHGCKPWVFRRIDP